MSVKKSRFPGNTSILGTDTFDFVRSGTNYKITYDNFVSAIGVTGTLSQAGATSPDGIPVLDGTSPNYSIRNIEAGSGIKGQTSAQNGISIEHNFGFNQTGAALTADASIKRPIFRSIVAGDGINVAESGNEIILSAGTVPVSNKTVQVDSLDDFPDPVGGVITLADETFYFIRDDLDVGTVEFVLGDGTVVSGPSRKVITMTYTGTGFFFTTSASGNSSLIDINLVASSGKLIDCKASTGNIFVMDTVFFTADEFGLFEGSGGVCRFSNLSGSVTTNGAQFTGDWRACLFDTIAASINGGTFFDLDSATFDAIYFLTFLVTLGSGTTFLSGLTNSDNINASGLGTFFNNRFSGSGTILSGVSVDDARWQFFLNDDVADTRPDGLLSLQDNTTDTVITTAGDPVLVAGTWNMERVSQFESTTAGRLTYLGGKDFVSPITATVSVNSGGGFSVQLSAYIAVNGVVVENSRKSAASVVGGSVSITIPWQINFEPNDYVEVFIANDDDNDDLLVTSAILRVN